MRIIAIEDYYLVVLLRIIILSNQVLKAIYMLLRSAFCSLGLFPKSDAKVANLVIRMYLLGKKCKAERHIIIPFITYPLCGVRK